MKDATTLTRDHIKMMRAADQLLIIQDQRRSTLSYSKRAADPPCDDLWCGPINVEPLSSGFREAVASVMCAQQRGHVRTILSLLRAEDQIAIRFLPDGGTNNYARTAITETEAGHYEGLHVDYVYVVILRKGKPKYEFFLDVSVCPANTARMVLESPSDARTPIKNE